jgi:hypothetical protein
VAQIEEALAATAAVTVTSPDRIMGRHSGSLRELDVSVRSRIGSADLHLILECRDRADSDDVTWIEALASKRDDVGADKAIAVSSSGFTAGARGMASAKGIQLRLLQDLGPLDVFDWLGVATFVYETRLIETFDRLQFTTKGVGSARILGGWDDPVIRRVVDQQSFSPAQIWNHCIDTHAVFRDLIPNGSGRVNGTVTIRFDPPHTHEIQTTEEYKPVDEMRIIGTFSVERTLYPISRIREYRHGDGQVLFEMAEVHVEHEGQPLVFSISSDSSSLYTLAARSADDTPLPSDLNLNATFEVGSDRVE